MEWLLHEMRQLELLFSGSGERSQNPILFETRFCFGCERGLFREDLYRQYVFLKDLKLMEAVEVDYEKDEIDIDLARVYGNVDVGETLSNLTGRWITRQSRKGIELEGGEEILFDDLDFDLVRPLIWW